MKKTVDGWIEDAGRAWDEVYRVGEKNVDGLIEGARTVRDAISFGDESAAAWKKIGDGVMGTLEGLGTLLGPPPEMVQAAYMSGDPEQIALIQEMQERQQAAVGAVVDSVKDAWNQAYARNGAVGASAMVLATLGMEVVGGKGTGALLRVGERVSEIVRLARTPLEAVRILDDEIAAARRAGKSAEEIRVLERARAERLEQARREAHRDGATINRRRLTPNSEYTLNGYRYTTDEYGRIKSVEGRLRLAEGTRNEHAQRTVGRDDGRLPNDQGRAFDWCAVRWTWRAGKPHTDAQGHQQLPCRRMGSDGAELGRSTQGRKNGRCPD